MSKKKRIERLEAKIAELEARIAVLEVNRIYLPQTEPTWPTPQVIITTPTWDRDSTAASWMDNIARYTLGVAQ